MPAPSKSPINVISDDDPNHTEEEWRALGYDSNTEYEEMRHRLTKVPEDSPGRPEPLRFKSFKSGMLHGKWGTDRLNIVLHCTWSPPPLRNKHVVCQRLVAAIHAVLPSDQRVTLRAVMATAENGGPYTMIFHNIMMRPSAQGWFERKVIPAVSAVRVHR